MTDTPETPAADDEPKASRPRVLVVEDNPVMGQIIGKLLQRMKLAYKAVPDGPAAIESVKAEKFDAVLMDIMMPGMNGRQATREIRKIGGSLAKLPIIAVTAKVDAADIDACLKAGMNGHVNKPINGANLKAALSRFLNIEAPKDIEPAKDMADLGIGKDELDLINWESFNEYRALLKKKMAGLLDDYLKAGPTLIASISKAINGGDSAKVEFLCHKLKSTSMVFGAESVSDIAATMERLGKGGDMGKAHALFEDLHYNFERTQNVLRRKLVLLRLES